MTSSAGKRLIEADEEDLIAILTELLRLRHRENRLPAAGSSEDEQRPIDVRSRFLLLGV